MGRFQRPTSHLGGFDLESHGFDPVVGQLADSERHRRDREPVSDRGLAPELRVEELVERLARRRIDVDPVELLHLAEPRRPPQRKLEGRGG